MATLAKPPERSPRTSNSQRRRQDSNLRMDCSINGLASRRLRPLGHASGAHVFRERTERVPRPSARHKTNSRLGHYPRATSIAPAPRSIT